WSTRWRSAPAATATTTCWGAGAAGAGWAWRATCSPSTRTLPPRSSAGGRRSGGWGREARGRSAHRERGRRSPGPRAWSRRPSSRCGRSGLRRDGFVEPVERALVEEGHRAHVAVFPGALGRGERHELLRAGQLRVELLRLRGGGGEVVGLRVAHQRGTRDLLRHPAQIGLPEPLEDLPGGGSTERPLRLREQPPERGGD